MTKKSKASGSNSRTRLLTLLDRFHTRRVVVIGDLIADEFLYGRISRISREAPVLVLEYHDLARLPGGAANAANNLLDLGCRVKVIAAVGEDAAGKDLTETLIRKGADTQDIYQIEAYCTPVKTRILASAHHSSPQQIVRVDRTAQADIHLNFPLRSAMTALPPPDALLISDYGLGVVSPPALRRLRNHPSYRNLPIVVDSRFRMSDFSRVTAITPNITELEAAVGQVIGSDADLLARIGFQVLKKLNLECLLVTQGRFGMTLIQANHPPLHIPIFGSDEVADVTGAGDTVIAVFTIAIACGALPEDAARLANYAGGIVVMKRGTATVTREELRSAINLDLD